VATILRFVPGPSRTGPSAHPAAGDHPPGIEPLPVWVPPGPTLVEVLSGAGAEIGTTLARPLLAGVLGALMVPPDARSRHARAQAAPVASNGDAGWFGPDSVAWRVQSDPSMFVAGIAAFALQLLHPLALAGVADHSAFAEDFVGRVQRTGDFVQGVVYGTSEEARARCEQVRRVHRRVVGTAPDGRPYDANDPELLEWVHLGEYLAIAAAYRRFGAAPLTPADLDRYIDEVAVVGEAIGVTDPPRSWSSLDAALQRFRPQLALGEQASAALRFLRDPPGLPAAVRPAWRVAFVGAMACLPPQARRLLPAPQPGLADLVVCRSLVAALRALLGEPPPLRAARARLGADAAR
jgi:uncharacterized protein (DUF2236 family)